MSERLILKNPESDFRTGLLREFEEQDYKNPNFLNSYNEMLNACKERYPKAGGYLGYRLHDSRVLSFSYSKNKSLETTFNDYYYIDFSWALMGLEKIKISRKKFVFPIKLKFTNLKKCLVYWCSRNSKLLPLKTEKYLPKVNEYLNGEIQDVGEDYLSVGFDFWSTGWRIPKYNLFLHVIAERFSVEEGQQKVPFNIFDNKYHSLLERFVEEVKRGQSFDITVAGNFIKANKNLIKG